MTEHPGLYTNLQWKAGSGPLFSSRDPSTGNNVWQGNASSHSDVDEAIHHAQTAFEGWSTLPFDQRRDKMLAFKKAVEDSQDRLTETICLETGKTRWDSKNEVKAMIGKIDISIEAFHERCPEIVKDLPAGKLMTRHKPHGVIAVFGPFNFPAHLPNGHIIPALLAGNTVIFKPSEITPLVAEEVMHLWEACGLPAGVLNLVQGGQETGKYLAAHPDLNGLFFTGSYTTGLILSEWFGSHPDKILALEMGGNNPIVVTHVNDIKAAAYITLQSAYLSSGQRCTCARRLIVPEGDHGDAFVESLLNMVKSISIGRYTDEPEPFMGPVISEAQALKILAAQDKLISQGAIPRLPMQHLIPGTGFLSPGLIDITPCSQRPDAEIFGPLLQLIRVKDFEEGIAEANHTNFGLSAGLLSDDEQEYRQFYQKIQAGVVNWNVALTGASSAAPFGGIGCSGNHRPSAYYAADYCAYPVASIESSSVQLPKALSPGLKLNLNE